MMEFDEETKAKLQGQREAFRKLMAEINGTYMDYETCSMLEGFLNDYTEVMIKEMQKSVLKLKEEYDFVPKTKEARK